MARLDREGAAFAGHHRRIAEPPGDPRPVERRRHHQNAQILAQAGLHVARQRQTEIGIQRALVKFVEQHRGDPVQLGIVQNLLREDAFGDDLDPGRARHFRAEPDAIADPLADRLPQRPGHPLGARPRGDPSRFQHDDAPAGEPRRVEQRQRHARGLARAGRRDQDRGIARGKRAGQRVENGIDRQRRGEGAWQGRVLGQWQSITKVL